MALLCCGINSTGQIVMEGFIKMRLAPLLAIAIIPRRRRDHPLRRQRHGRTADADTGGLKPATLLRRLPAGDVYRDKVKMGEPRSPLWLSGFAWLIAVVIAALNVKLLMDFIG
ncbi:Divalent metal cation transporter MntH (fragment) [Agrobacterium genomosp. 2 str. CFBP 5494]|uniref:Divalent metal cation transporter MntH n=1 Tax=Agrobacterium genomosp. 2 str. CFBP 5494 TaxID=1183436 RepID=A0A9W5AZN4_9HYPH